jgi:hypothetical protein
MQERSGCPSTVRPAIVYHTVSLGTPRPKPEGIPPLIGSWFRTPTVSRGSSRGPVCRPSRSVSIRPPYGLPQHSRKAASSLKT